MGYVVYEVLFSEAALNFYQLYTDAQAAFVCLFKCSLMHGGAEIFQETTSLWSESANECKHSQLT